MTNTIINANFNQDITTKGTSINYKENTVNKEKQGIQGIFSGVVMSEGSKTGTDNTYESLLKETDDVKSQIMASASDAKLGLKALMKKLSGADAVKIDEDGFNLTDATEEDMVNIIDKIKIELAMHSDDYVNYGMGVSADKIESVTGSAGLAQAVESRMSDANIAVNDESVEEVTGALREVGELKPLSEDTKNYMVAQGTEATIDGIYKAQAVTASGGAVADMKHMTASDKLSDADFEALKPGIEKLLTNAGLEASEENLENARTFIDSGIPVTEENLSYKAQLDSLDIVSIQQDTDSVLTRILDNMTIGGRAGDTSLTKSPTDEIIVALDTLNKAEYSDIANVVSKGSIFTIASLKLEIDARSFSIDYAVAQVSGNVPNGSGTQSGVLGALAGDFAATGAQQDSTEISAESARSAVDKAYDTLVQTRVLMSTSASIYLVKNNISLLDTPLEELDSAIMAYEKETGIYETEGVSYETVLEARKTIDNMVRNPERVFANLYDKAVNTYEAVGTQVRSDLGDSLKKAVERSAESVIEEIGLEDTVENKEAVKVLAANSMDITEENVDRMKYVNAMIKNLVNNMKPETVLNMIKDGVNPMNSSIEEVNEYLTVMNQEASRDNEEKFSKFLYKLDRTDGITADQRKQFIGIYQMMNIFTRDAGVAAGALVKQGAEVTMNNLMTAYNSRKHYGMDRTVDDTTGMAEVDGVANYYSALFAANGGLVTPNTLKNVDNSVGIGAQSAERFVSDLEDNYDAEAEAEYYDEYMKLQAAALDAKTSVLREIRRADIGTTSGNIQAVKAFMESGQFPQITGIKTTQDFAKESIEKIRHEKELSLMFEEMQDEVGQELQEAISLSGDLDTELDINYEEFLDLRLKDRTIGYISNLATKHDYRIPYATEDGAVGMINLTLVQDDENRGRISVNMESKALGKVSVEAKTDGEKMNIFMVSSSDVTDEAQDVIDAMTERLKEQFGLGDVNVYSGKSEDVPYIQYENAGDSVATDRLYEMAGAIVEMMAG